MMLARSGRMSRTAFSEPDRTAEGADAVVLADGGFQANPTLMKKYVGTDEVRLRATGMGTGDGLLMGLAAGGVGVNMNGFYGHLLARASSRRLRCARCSTGSRAFTTG